MLNHPSILEPQLSVLNPSSHHPPRSGSVTRRRTLHFTRRPRRITTATLVSTGDEVRLWQGGYAYIEINEWGLQTAEIRHITIIRG